MKKSLVYSKTMVRDLDSLTWNLSPRCDVAYAGWLGRGNLGDEAMFLSHRQRLRADLTMMKAPINGWSRRLSSATRPPRSRVLLVGGGTILGHTSWLKSISEARRLLEPERFVIFGAGMEDLEFALSKGLATDAALQAWSRLLNEADYVGVRGARSQQHLRAIGVDSEVIGDAALWFDGTAEAPSPRRATDHPYVAVNVIASSNGFAVDHESRRSAVGSFAKNLLDMGIRVVLFGMERNDVREAHRIRQLVPQVEITPWNSSVPALFELLRGSRLVVAERLHGAILAAAADVPFMILAYKPKSYDFAESVNVGDACVEPHEFTADALTDRAETLMTTRHQTTAVRESKRVLAARFDTAHRRWMDLA